MNRDELTRLMTSHQVCVYRYLRYLGADPPAAEDLCQEVFLAVARDAARGRLDTIQHESAWLRGVARNLFLSWCRRRRNSPVVVSAAAAEQAESLWQSDFLGAGDGSDYLHALRLCVSYLPERQRALVAMQYAQEKSRAEMAQATGLTEDGIKSTMRRIRARLAECVLRRRTMGEGDEA